MRSPAFSKDDGKTLVGPAATGSAGESRNPHGAFVRFQQRLHALAERGVPATGVIEVRRALLGWQFHRRVKDGGFPLVGFAHETTVLRLPDKARFGKKKGQYSPL